MRSGTTSPRETIETFDDFTDRVEAILQERHCWTDVHVADFVSRRTCRMIQAYQDGTAALDAAGLLQIEPPTEYWDREKRVFGIVDNAPRKTHAR